MNSKQEYGFTSPVTREEAFDLLFSKKEDSLSEQSYFDEYGNYVFPTDLVANTPNSATGTSSGFSIINYA